MSTSIFTVSVEKKGPKHIFMFASPYIHSIHLQLKHLNSDQP